MGAEFGPLYHWSPKGCRDSILHNGLHPGSKNVLDEGDHWRSPAVHFGLDPSGAWLLSGDTHWDGMDDDGESDWDLWQLDVATHDDLRVRAEDGRIKEILIYNVLPPDRLWWVGERQPWLTYDEKGSAQ